MRIILAARLGGIGVVRSADGDQDHNTMDLAFLACAMFETAKESIKISQQDMGPVVVSGVAPYAWSWEYTDALNRAILRGVHVYVTLSTISTQTYAYGFTLQDVSDKFVKSFKRVASSNDNAKWKAAHCKYFHLGYIRTVAGEDRYKPFKAVETVRENRIGNHAKLVAVDDSIFYWQPEFLRGRTCGIWPVRLPSFCFSFGLTSKTYGAILIVLSDMLLAFPQA